MTTVCMPLSRAHFLHTEHFNFLGQVGGGEEAEEAGLVASVK